MGCDVHDAWIEQLSDYLDDELSSGEREAVEQHLLGCADCRAVLNDLKSVVARAHAVTPRAPQADLWGGIAQRMARGTGLGVRSQPRPVPLRLTFTLPQLAAAAALLVAVSAGLAWQLGQRAAEGPVADSAVAVADGPYASIDAAPERDTAIVPVVLADAQFDAAVADLEKAVNQGRGRLDASTVATVRHNLQIIDQAIAQAREALESDPANSYLNGHLVDARRRKLDLLRRAAELTSETN